MDMSKVLDDVKYKLDRNYKIYNNSESVEERRQCIANYISTLNYIKSSSKGKYSKIY